MLDIKENGSTRRAERGKIKEIEKHVDEIETWVEEIRDLKGKMQELMIKGVKAWTNQAESDLQRCGQPLGILE